MNKLPDVINKLKNIQHMVKETCVNAILESKIKQADVTSDNVTPT